jgi:hypothetical protein
MRMWTVGHSTHSIDAFVALLVAHDIAQVADIRPVPKSAGVRRPTGSQMMRRGLGRGGARRHSVGRVSLWRGTDGAKLERTGFEVIDEVFERLR